MSNVQEAPPRKSIVYYIPYVEEGRFIPLLKRLLRENWYNLYGSGDFVAVKLHFGEKGVTTHIKPHWVKEILSVWADKRVKFFLTDTVTLYHGERMDAIMYLNLIREHGFDTIGVPIIIADGLRGDEGVDIEINGQFYRYVNIATGIVKSDAMLVLTHFTGHELTGFGATIKNLGMGCSTRRGKLSMHSTLAPRVVLDRCKACGTCARWCSVGAITVTEYAIIDEQKCSGCAACIAVCPEGAIRTNWNESSDNAQRKIAEYALGAVKGKPVLYVTFLLNITKLCDCFPSDKIEGLDRGVLVSEDPVALDMASYELVDYEATMRKLRPEIDPLIQVRHAAEVGLGSMDYELITLGDVRKSGY